MFLAIMQIQIVICEDPTQQASSDPSSPVASSLTDSEVSGDSLDSEVPILTELRQKVDLRSTGQPAVSLPASCRAKTFLEMIYGDFCAVRDGSQEFDDEDDDEDDREVTSVSRRIVCVEKTAQHQHTLTVQLFNSSQLLSHLGSRANSSIFGRCTVVLFYAPWCAFCVRLAPHYNALARAFPTLDVVAIDAYQFSR